MELSTDLAPIAGKPWMAFDIETVPMPGCAEYLTDPIEAPANYKDPVKIAAYIAAKRATQIAEAGLDLDLCEVAAIAGELIDSSWCRTREQWSEAKMLEAFWWHTRVLHSVGGDLVGFNCLGFDLPVLQRRSLYLGVPVPPLSVDKYRHDGIIDLQQVLTYGGKTTWRSLAFYCKRFGIPYDDSVTGEDITELVAGQDWAAVEKRCRGDAASTAALAARCGLIHMPVAAL